MKMPTIDNVLMCDGNLSNSISLFVVESAHVYLLVEETETDINPLFERKLHGPTLNVPLQFEKYILRRNANRKR